ncbi:bacteriohemerythrin [Vibrio mexicanus]|uniref:bacteriohemerythrin n=1 Tax=Vibrio mexicanus TaxID=1004326 RepID=UPI00063C5E2D|nr:bacteriohemerythrin [Vibrio mexicanus]
MFGSVIEKVSTYSGAKWTLLLIGLASPLIVSLVYEQSWISVALYLIYQLIVISLLVAINDMLRRLRDASVHLSEGDLTVRINSDSSVGKPLYKTFNRIGEDVSRTVSALGKSTARLLEVANQVQTDSELSREGALGQKRDVDTAKNAIDQLTSITEQVSHNCESTAQLAFEAKEKAAKGIEDMVKLEESLANANQHIDNSNEHFQSLMEETTQISQVMETISGIAEQTNLLALNAAIESARAGEQGRGFAVVADEVRSLAMRTQEATEEIRTKINNLQLKTDDVLQTMQENKSSMEESLNIASEAELSFKALSEQIEELSLNGQNIASSSEQQLSQTEELNRCLHLVAEESDNNVRATQETLIASITVRNLSGEIDSLLHRFALDENQVTAEEKKRDKLMEWSSELDIGLAEINRQHQTLLHLINELNHLLKHNYGLASVKRVVQGLIGYTANHFKYEEILFEQVGYSGTKAHIEKHNNLVGQVLEFQKRVESGEDIGEELLSFLKDWLRTHIMSEDKAYSKTFIDNGLG